MSNLVRPQIGFSSQYETVLNRAGNQSPLETPFQNQIDGLVGSFISQATEWKSLAALTVGGLAYRWGKIGVLTSPLAASRVGHVTAMPLRALSVAVGLGSEVTAYEFTHCTLYTFTGDHTGSPLQNQSPNLWSWSGPGGWKEGGFSSFVAFGTIKGFGRLSHGQNLILQHGFQDAGMVLGHQLVHLAGLGPKPKGSIADQFVHAEATNLQIRSASMLLHSLSDGRFMAFERGLDLTLRSMGSPSILPLLVKGGNSSLGQEPVLDPADSLHLPLPQTPRDLIKGLGVINLKPHELKSGGPGSYFDHGPLGRFTREMIGDVSVFTPLLERPPSLQDQAKLKGLLILFSGSGLNHTCFGQLPKELAGEGWNVKIAVPPGFENPHQLEHFGQWTVRARTLAEGWESSLRKATEELIKRHSDIPLFLGGFSMGAAGSVLIYEGLPKPLQQMVEGLILAAPAFYPARLKPERPLFSWVIRHMALPLLSLVNHVNHRSDRRIFSELESHIPLTIQRPAKMAFGTVLFVEKARESALRLKGRKNLPRTYLLHGGVSDEVVSKRSFDFTRKTLGPNRVEEQELPDEGHYVLAGEKRQEAYDQIKTFLDRAPS